MRPHLLLYLTAPSSSKVISNAMMEKPGFSDLDTNIVSCFHPLPHTGMISWKSKVMQTPRAVYLDTLVFTGKPASI